MEFKKDSKVPAKNLLISLYAESRPKMNFRRYLIFQLTFKDSKPQRILTFDRLLTYSELVILLFTFCFYNLHEKNFGQQLLSLWELTGVIPFTYSHLSNKHGGWNKRGGWDFVEKTNA